MMLRNMSFESQEPVAVNYKGIDLGDDLPLDIVVPGRLVVELKAVEKRFPIHEAQPRTYLKLTRLSSGLLINFNVCLLKDGIKRRVP
jgi:GxxExxY protein